MYIKAFWGFSASISLQRNPYFRRHSFCILKFLFSVTWWQLELEAIRHCRNKNKCLKTTITSLKRKVGKIFELYVGVSINWDGLRTQNWLSERMKNGICLQVPTVLFNKWNNHLYRYLMHMEHSIAGILKYM